MGEIKKGGSVKEKIAVAISICVLFGIAWGAFSYLGDKASCEDVKKLDAKIDKTAQQSDAKFQKTMDIMDLKFLSIQLQDLDGRIDRQEQVVKKEPRNENAKQVLYELRQDRKKVIEQIDALKKK